MAKMTKDSLRKLILAEMEKMMGEEVIFSKNDYYDVGMLSKHDDPGRNIYVTSCAECGTKMYEQESSCSECGTMYESSLNKGLHKDIKVGNHKHYKGSYMAKSHLYKVNKYAEKLYHMIPDGHNLEDWMRTKIAQIADDIGEVYHALDHDKFEGDI